MVCRDHYLSVVRGVEQMDLLDKIDSTENVEQDRQYWVNRLMQSFRELNTNNEYKDPVDLVLDEAISFFQADKGFILLGRDTDSLKFERGRDDCLKDLKEKDFDTSQTFIREAIQSGLPAFLDDILLNQNFNTRHLLPRLKFISLTCMPLKSGGELQGVIVLVNSRPLFNKSAIRTSICQLFSDQVTFVLQKAAQEEKERETTDQLTRLQEQLIHAEKMASRGKIAAEIGHEINHLLSGLYGNIELAAYHLQDSKKSEKVLKGLYMSAETVIRMNRYARALAENTAVGTKKEKCDLNEVVQDFIDFITPILRRTKAVIKENFQVGLPQVEIDKGQIHQILHNMIRNAIEAKIDANIVIKTYTNKSKDRISLSISDNGPGMKAKKIEKIFNQLIDDKNGGNGFGLGICKKIVENHDGTISVQTEPGYGTKFIISFPVKVESDPVELEVQHLGIAEQSVSYSYS